MFSSPALPRKNLWLLVALVNLLLTPVYYYVLELVALNVIVAICFLITILAGIRLCAKARYHYLYYAIGAITVLSVIAEFFFPSQRLLQLIRTCGSALFFGLLLRITMGNLLRGDKVDRDVIYGAVAGYLLLAFAGGAVFELLHHTVPGAFRFDAPQSGDFQFYYFSLVGVSTVGFGDIVPANPMTQSITMLINISGQLYLAIVMAMFVGKYMNQKT